MSDFGYSNLKDPFSRFLSCISEIGIERKNAQVIWVLKALFFLIKHICGYNKIGSKGKFQGEGMILSLKFCPLVWVGN